LNGMVAISDQNKDPPPTPVSQQRHGLPPEEWRVEIRAVMLPYRC
jgi:hypothetical protein